MSFDEVSFCLMSFSAKKSNKMSFCKMSFGKMSFGKMSFYEMSFGRMSFCEMSFGETPFSIVVVGPTVGGTSRSILLFHSTPLVRRNSSRTCIINVFMAVVLFFVAIS
jgi:hypothetical protein